MKAHEREGNHVKVGKGSMWKTDRQGFALGIHNGRAVGRDFSHVSGRKGKEKKVAFCLRDLFSRAAGRKNSVVFGLSRWRRLTKGITVCSL